jgi:hypothetical protein
MRKAVGGLPNFLWLDGAKSLGWTTMCAERISFDAAIPDHPDPNRCRAGLRRPVLGRALERAGFEIRRAVDRARPLPADVERSLRSWRPT